ncbi:MAG: ATP-binding protein, partial [candidate division Zixibacteria bacterium]
PGKPSLFYGLRLRHAVALLACLAIILVFAGYFSVSAGKKAAFDSVTAQGRALTETLISSAEMIIEADNEFIELGLEQLSTIIAEYQAQDLTPDEKMLEELAESTESRRVSFIENRKVEISASSGVQAPGTSEVETWLGSLTIDPDAEIIYEFLPVDGERFFWGYFPYDKTSGVFVAKEWVYGQYGNEKLSLYHLLNLVGRETGVEYIMLQNPEGIVFASKKVASMKSIFDDPFLMETGDTTQSRIIEFQDREVLETVRKFQYGEFDGLFRVGLSLYGYRIIANSVKRQVWLVVAALIIVGMLGFGAVVGFQNFDLLRQNLQKANVVSKSILDSLPGPVVAVDSALHITDINSAALDLFGLQARSLHQYPDLFPDDPFQLLRVLESKRNAGFESDMGKSDRWFFVTATPLITLDGSAMGAIAIAQDITDVKKVGQMAESRKRLSEMGALAASMAHEIRNPLNAIGITIQRMKSEIKPIDGQDEYEVFLDGLKMEISRLNSIIEKFLAVARSVKPRLEKSDINELISSVVNLFSDQTRSQDISLYWKPGKTLIAKIDEAALTQALMNVVKNSIEAIIKGGNIEVVAQALDDEKVRISVIDNGPGIEDATTALKPFHTTKDSGTGLGLATASSILADHGGELVIESSPGKGCRIDLIFPALRSES